MSSDDYETDFYIKKVRVPHFIYGTAWKEEKTADCIINALKAGFTGIDTANQRKHYFEAQVGDALNQAFNNGLAKREQLFLQTKFTYQQGQDHRLPYDANAKPKEQVEQSFQSSLSHLGVDYIDSYLLHGPEYTEGISDTDIEIWQTMKALSQNNKIKLLGVSNISANQLVQLCNQTKIQPNFVQNRCFARTGWDFSVREICKKLGIIYQGFSLLTANMDILKLPDFQLITQETGLTAAQVVFQSAQALGMMTLTGTTCFGHMQEDLSCHHKKLTEEHIELFEQLLYNKDHV